MAKKPTPKDSDRDEGLSLLRFQLDADAPPGDVLPVLARLCRQLRDREQAEDCQKKGGLVPKKPCHRQ